MSTNRNRDVAPPRISHMVLRTTCLKDMIEWYKTGFNAKVLYESGFGASSPTTTSIIASRCLRSRVW